MLRFLPALVLTIFLGVAASTATAADPMPQPDCHGQQAKDAEGDSANSTTGSETGVPSSDLTGGWITYDPAANKAQANIQVANLTEGEMNDGYTGISWQMAFTAAKPWYVRGFTDITGTTIYQWGEPRAITDDQTTPRQTGTTTGKLFPGKGGVIQVDIPLADMAIKPGETLKAIALQVRQWVTKPAAVQVPSAVPLYSYAPIFDEAAGKGGVTLGPCAAGPAPSVPATPTAPTVDNTPTSGPAKLALKVTVPKLTAKKANKAKKITFKLSGTASGLAAALKRGGPDGKLIASGKLRACKGRGKLVVKLKKKVKKGTYTLFVTGKNADGKAAEGAVGVKIR